MMRLEVERCAATATWRQWRRWRRWRRRLRKTTTTRRLLRRRRQRQRRRLRPRGTRQYTKRRRRSASVHETIVDEKLAPSGRDEERESRRREIARDTHVHERTRTPWRTCVCACARGCTERAGTRENEEERERKKGNRDTSDHGGDSPAHALLPQKLAHYEHERKKKYAQIYCVRTSPPVCLLYTHGKPSSSSRSNDSFSFFRPVLPRSSSPARSMYACVSVWSSMCVRCTYMHVYTRYVFNTRCACTRERRKENESNRDEEGLTRVCETEREAEKQGAQSETLEWEIIKMAARATYSTSSTPPPPPPIPTLLFLLFGRPTRRAASRGNRQALRRTI